MPYRSIWQIIAFVSISLVRTKTLSAPASGRGGRSRKGRRGLFGAQPSKRPASITLDQAATKSATNFSAASSLA